MVESGFKVRAAQYEGPLDVLIELIEKRKFFVSDVSLASVTDEYLAYINERKVPAEQVAGFVSIAATLILIKARSLLPNLELSQEEEQSIAELELRLSLYKLISDAAPKLISMYGKNPIYQSKSKIEMKVFAPDPTLSIQTFPEIIKEIFGRVPKEKPKNPEAVVYKTISISEVLGSLAERISRAVKTTFSQIAVASPDKNTKSQKVYTIISFLGMLELVRRGHIDADQSNLFEEINIERLKTPEEPIELKDE